MTLEILPSLLECLPHLSPPHQPFAASSLSPTLSLSSSNRQTPRRVFLSNPSQSSDKTFSRGQSVKRSCCSNLGDIFYGEPSFHTTQRFSLSDGDQENEGVSPSTSQYGVIKNSSLPSKFEFLEPMKLGIRPEAPDWPEREAVMWATLEQKAKSFDLPLSLRMVKKKLRLEEAFTHSEDSVFCSVKKAFASMVFIVVELQSYALQMRGALCHEDLEIIIAKVQKEMNSSFVWLFQQVFSRTPTLMIYVIILLANFSVYSACHNHSTAEAFLLGSSPSSSSSSSTGSTLVSDSGVSNGNKQISKPSRYLEEAEEEISKVDDEDLQSMEELDLWNSVVDEAKRIGGGFMNVILDREAMQQFVSPISVELEPDNYEEYSRTNLLYQIALSQEPNNPLLLCNYAQFLRLVPRDYDRAEQCFKKAVQAQPPDAESLSQYATFLWTARQDYWAAEERYLQALAIEPDNSYYASKYANFLWNTGGEDTCFLVDNSLDSS